jgi:hypothetical protein
LSTRASTTQICETPLIPVDLAYAARLSPPFRRIAIIGHQLVKADWNRFSPTNTVNQRNRLST